MAQRADPPATHGSPVSSDAEYSRLRADLERAVRRICPRWLADRSEDLVQVALMRVMEIRRKSEGKREFSSFYLKRVAYSALVDEIRRCRRRQETPLEEADAEAIMAAEGGSPERSYVASEIARGIRGCLALLPRPRRLAVTLHLQGHSVPQAAKLLGWSVKRVENLVYRGLSDLRQCLASKGLVP